MDQAISIVVVYLVLSLITEEITNVFKLKMQRLREKHPTLATEKKREKRITGLSILIGFVVALGTRADTFAMLTSDTPRSTLGWDIRNGVTWSQFGLALPGCFLSALVLSLGSRFWHECFDLLLQTRRLKEKLKEEKICQVQSSNELLDRRGKDDDKSIGDALKDNRERLLSTENVVAVGQGVKEVNGQKRRSVIVHVRRKVEKEEEVEKLRMTRQLLPRTISHNLPGGLQAEFPVDVIEVGEVRTCSSVPGGAIANEHPLYGAGTIGCVVRDALTQTDYLLTCYHVLISGHDWKWLVPRGRERVVAPEGETTEEELGLMVYGTRTAHLDMALVRLQPDVKVSRLKGHPKGTRDITWSDVFEQPEVRFKGKTSPDEKKGLLINKDMWAVIKYPDGELWKLENLLVVAKQSGDSWSAISTGGDSGAVVVDNDLNALGMIVATGDNVSYAIPMTAILSHAGLEIA